MIWDIAAASTIIGALIGMLLYRELRLFQGLLHDWLADRIIALSLRRPWVHIEGYMERYWIVSYTSWCRWFPAMRVHHILRSDQDRYCHDHPWTYITVILRVGYWEIQPLYDRSGLYHGEKRTWRGPGTILIRPAKSWHRLEVPEGQTAWTLFISFAWRQKWGFLTQPDHKMRYEEFLGLTKRDGS